MGWLVLNDAVGHPVNTTVLISAVVVTLSICGAFILSVLSIKRDLEAEARLLREELAKARKQHEKQLDQQRERLLDQQRQLERQVNEQKLHDEQSAPVPPAATQVSCRPQRWWPDEAGPQRKLVFEPPPMYFWGSLCWGSNQSKLPLPLRVDAFEGSSVVSVAAAGRRLLFLSKSGDAYEGGEIAPAVSGRSPAGMYGRSEECCGQEMEYTGIAPRLVDTLAREKALHNKRVEAVACGPEHCVVVVGEVGDVFSWGKNADGRLGRPSSAAATPSPISSSSSLSSAAAAELSADPVPRRVMGLFGKGVIEVQCGDAHTLALTSSGDVYSWGRGKNGRLGHGDTRTHFEPKLVSALNQHSKRVSKIRAVACGSSFSLAMDEQGDLLSWGKGSEGQCGVQFAVDQLRPIAVEHLGDSSGGPRRHVVAAACGRYHAVALCASGDVYAWGFSEFGALGTNSNSQPIPSRVSFSNAGVRLPDRVHAISCGEHFTIALTFEGKALSWGRNDTGALATGDLHNRFEPGIMSVASLDLIACGNGFCVALNNATEGVTRVPRSIDSESNVAAVANGEATTMDAETPVPVEKACMNSPRVAQPARVLERSQRQSEQGEADLTATSPPQKHAAQKPWVSPYFVSRKGSRTPGRSTRTISGPITLAAIEGARSLSSSAEHSASDALLSSRRGHHLNRSVDLTPPRRSAPNSSGNLDFSRGGVRFASDRADGRPRSASGSGSGLLQRQATSEVNSGGSLRSAWSFFKGGSSDDGGSADAKRIERRERKRERRMRSNLREWREILPKWAKRRREPFTQALWRQGLPPEMRGVVWPLAVENELRITPTLFEMYRHRARFFQRESSERRHRDCNVAVRGTSTGDRMDGKTSLMGALGRETTMTLILTDLPRTFPRLRLFDPEGPFYERLRTCLETFVCYRPDLGYVQGMSYIAANICLYAPDAYLAFQVLANLVLVRGHLFAFFMLDDRLIRRYYRVWERILAEEEPEVARRLIDLGIDPHLYLFQWLQTLFLKVLPLETATRVWDCFLLEGVDFAFRTSLAIVRLFRDRLLTGSFESSIQLLSCSPGTRYLWERVMEQDTLFATLEDLKLSSTTTRLLNEVTCDVYFFQDPEISRKPRSSAPGATLSKGS